LKFQPETVNKPFPMSARPLVLVCAASLLLVACRKTDVTSYRIPKEKDPEMPGVAATAGSTASAPAMEASAGAAPGASQPGMTNTAVPTASGAQLTWNAPAHWKRKPASSMRKGSYAVPGDGGVDADVSITAFPGDVGGELANINRWRGQVQLPPVSEADLATSVTRLEANGLKIAVVDLAGANGGADAPRILGAIVPFGGATWFFKLGPAPGAPVEKEKGAFLEFVKTIQAAAP